MRFAVLLGSLWCLSTSCTWAASLGATITKEGKVALSLEGEILEGDNEKLRAQIATANNGGRLVSGLRLSSEGGSLSEGILLAETVRNAKIATVVANGARCASACFVIFAAGTEKYASYSAWVGVHGASDSAGRETTSSGAATVTMAKVVKELGVPSSIIGKMVVTPPSQIVWLGPNDLRSMGTTLTGKPSQLSPPEQPANSQPLQLSPSIKANTPPSWGDFVNTALELSRSQNNGRPDLSRSCQPELKICNTGIFFKGKDGNSMLVKATEDLSGKIVRREVCSFNAFNDVRTCLDWDTGSTHKDMKGNDGQWSKVD